METQEKQTKVKGETQASDKPYQVFLTYFVVVFLLALIVTNYFFVFSSRLYAPWGKYCLDGTFDASTYYGAKDCDLIVILKTDVDELQVGDIVCYCSLNRGSGKLVDIQTNHLALEKEDGTIINVGKNSIIGKQAKTVAVLGFFLEFVSSYVGIIVLNVLLLAYIAFITFRRINYENTSEGKRLYAKFVEDRKAMTERRLLLKKVEKAGEIDVIVHSVIAGDFEQNKQALENFDLHGASPKEKYKFILTEVYTSLISKPRLNRTDNREINRAFELMFEAGEIDLDIEYMLIDLALRVKNLKVDLEAMAQSAKSYFEREHTYEELNLVGAVLYVIIYNHKELRDKEFAKILGFYQAAVSKIDDFQQKPVGLVLKNMKKMLKT